MKMCEPLQQTFWQETELPLMSSRAASRAKTLALRESRLGLVKEPDLACGLKSSDLLASYDRATSSWRTSQTCLVALATNEADGLAEFSETWPSAGMMRNGKTYRRQPWALPIAEKESGLWPTPLKSSMQANFSVQSICKVITISQEHLCYRPTLMGWSRQQVTTLYALAMGFPNFWASLTDTETQSSPKSPNS